MTTRDEARQAKRIADLRAKHSIPESSVFAAGVASWVEFDGSTITVQRLTSLSKRPRTQVQVPLRELVTVEFSPARGMKSGYVRFITAGTTTTDAQIHGFGYSPDGDPYASSFLWTDTADYTALVAAVEAARQEAPRDDQPSALADLERLAALRESGVLTADEFEAKKADLLRRI